MSLEEHQTSDFVLERKWILFVQIEQGLSDMIRKFERIISRFSIKWTKENSWYWYIVWYVILYENYSDLNAAVHMCWYQIHLQPRTLEGLELECFHNMIFNLAGRIMYSKLIFTIPVKLEYTAVRLVFTSASRFRTLRGSLLAIYNMTLWWGMASIAEVLIWHLLQQLQDLIWELETTVVDTIEDLTLALIHVQDAALLPVY